MERGYVKLWRCSADSYVFKNDGLWRVWTWCLMRASHKHRRIHFPTGTGIAEIDIGPGQFVCGRLSAAKELGMKPTTFNGRLTKLKQLKNIDIRADSRYSVITVINWATYQQDNDVDRQQERQQSDSRPTVDRQQADTNKNDKHYKNGKNLILGTQIDPAFEVTSPMRTWFAEKGFRFDLDLETETFVNYWLGEGKRKKDWVATWRTWMLKAAKMRGNNRGGGGEYKRKAGQVVL